MPRFSECWRCGKTGASVVCRACDIAKYCSNVCQRNDKSRYEADCKPVAIVRSCSSCKKSGSVYGLVLVATECINATSNAKSRTEKHTSLIAPELKIR